jgi:hypothetical protein
MSEPRISSHSQLITLKWDSTVDVPGMTAAKPLQNCINSETRTPAGRQPSAKLTTLGIFKLFTQAVSLWIAHLNSFNSLSRCVQSS